jgi:hypothetical protein
MSVDSMIQYLRDREYMSGIQRDENRVRATGEVFTPTPLVQEVLDQMDPALFTEPGRTFLDPACGDGQFLSEVLIRKLESGQDLETALASIYGVDIMIDNVDLCRERLLCGCEEFRHIVEKNIVCQDGTRYRYSFRTPGQAQRDREQRLRIETTRQKNFDRLFEEQKIKKPVKKIKNTKQHMVTA